MKKASANIWWIIIGAVVALVVLIVILVIFTSKAGELEKGLLSCQNKGGDCQPQKDNSCEDVCGESQRFTGAFTCPGDGCCCIGT